MSSTSLRGRRRALAIAAVLTVILTLDPAPAGAQAPSCAPITLERCRVTTRIREVAGKDAYTVRCGVQLGAGSNGIDPESEGIRFVLTDGDSPSCTRPCAGATVIAKRTGRCWRYDAHSSTTASLPSIKLCEVHPEHGAYRLLVRARRADLRCLNGPAPYSVGVTIGDDCSEPCPDGFCPALAGQFPLGACRDNDPSYDTCPATPLCSCSGTSCTPPTSEADDCRVSARSAGGAVFKCCDGTTCGFEFAGSGGTCATCDSGTSCDLYVGGAGGGYVDCVDAARCDVLARPAGDCRVDCGSNCRVSPAAQCCVTCASGPAVDCPDGSVVCGRPCEEPVPASTKCNRDWSTGFEVPQDIDLAPSGEVIYLLETGRDRVVMLDRRGNMVGQWPTGNPPYMYPRGIATDSMGNVYVTNDENVIRKYGPTGTFEREWGGPGSGDGQLASPDGIATDLQGNVYVAERYNHRIQKFDSAGGFLAKWGTFGSGDGELDEPRDVAVDAAGNIFVFEEGNSRIQKFSPAGGFLVKWGDFGAEPGQFHVAAGRMNLDAAGNLYVCDSGNSRIQKFSGTGTFLDMWSTFGSGEGAFNVPHGIAIDGDGNAYVVDYQNGRVQKCR